MIRTVFAGAALLLTAGAAMAEPPRQAPSVFTAADVFRLESASSPEISPDGKRVAYVRVSADPMTDRFRRSIWIVDETGANHRALAQGSGSYSSPVWSPDGKSLAYVANEDKATQLRVFHFDTERSMTLGALPGGARNLAWSPDGKTLAFEAFVQESGVRPAAMPNKPDGADWAEPAKVFDQIIYRADGEGLLDSGYTQIFVMPADGGVARQLTWAARNHDGRLAWLPDGQNLIYSANTEENWQYAPVDSSLYQLDINTGVSRRLTSRNGPEDSPALSPDGKRVAYVGFDDKQMSYQVSDLYVADADGANGKALTAGFDRDIVDPQWAADGGIWFLFEDKGDTKLGRISPRGGAATTMASGLVGSTVDRPYTGGAYSVNKTGRFATLVGDAAHPAEVAISLPGGKLRTLTSLNTDVFTGKSIAAAEAITVPSSFDKRPIDAWILRPPGFDPSKKYPLLLEIHGGPHSAYGPTFAAEAQLFAAAGYVVVYSNPRGSTSYGQEFAALIDKNYPSQDYDDLMSVVDAVITKGSIDDKRLYVTGGSGGGALTAWIVGTTGRFRAAMAQKPVINWTSEVLSADSTNYFARYWFGEMPWDKGAQERYWARSPLSRVGNVTTPTAVLVGEVDNRTPPSEAEQFYQALQLRKVPTRLVRIPGASHDIAGRPTGLIAKVANTLDWFAVQGGPSVPDPDSGAASSAPVVAPAAR